MRQTTTTVQPIGAFAFPTGLLLISDRLSGPDVDGVRAGLVDGLLPDAWPPQLRGHQLAHADDLVGAAAFFKAAALDDAAAAFNHYVLAPDGVDTAALRSRLPEELQPL